MRLIDADALRARMYNDAFEVDSDMQKWESGCWIRYKMFENAIDDAPTIEPKRGEWIDNGKWINKTIPVSMANPYGGIIVGIACSVCGYDGENEQLGKISNRIIERFNFCPNCGADMRGADDEDN